MSQPDPLQPEGDLPSPRILAAYKQVSPECLTQILDVFKKQAEHIRDLERDELEARIVRERQGQWLGFVISMFAITAGLTIALWGYPWTGACFSSSWVIGLTSIFVLGRRYEPEAAEPPSTPESELTVETGGPKK